MKVRSERLLMGLHTIICNFFLNGNVMCTATGVGGGGGGNSYINYIKSMKKYKSLSVCVVCVVYVFCRFSEERSNR